MAELLRSRRPLPPGPSPLSDEEVQTFIREGVVVIRGALSPEEVTNAREGLHAHLRGAVGLDVTDLDGTASGLRALSSTNGSGGVLDVWYPPFKLELMQHPLLFAMMSQLWAATFAAYRAEEEGEGGTSSADGLYRHRHGPFDARRGFAYIDRVGFRVPSRVAKLHEQRLDTGTAQGSHSKTEKRKKRARPLQRSLTPHLDCCPHQLHGLVQGGKAVRKWRPLQSFVALTDTLHPDEGGFEAAKAFHHDFDEWAERRAGRGGSQTDAAGGAATAAANSGDASPLPPPCVGEFTPIRPGEDAEVLRRMAHVPCRAGDLIVWDNRIPHANSRENRPFAPSPDAPLESGSAAESSAPTGAASEGEGAPEAAVQSAAGERAREVVYLGWLPDVLLNREYVAAQLSRFRAGVSPVDQWQEMPSVGHKSPPAEPEQHASHGDVHTRDKAHDGEAPLEFQFSELGRKLFGIESW